MEERFKILVSKYLDDKLSDQELAEFEKYLEDPACNSYFKKAEYANKLIDESFQNLIEAAEKKAGITKEENEFPEEIIADSDAYTERNNPFIIEKVKNAHRQMILKRRKRGILILVPIAAILVITLIVFLPDRQSLTPQQLSKNYYKKYECFQTRGGDESEGLYNKAISEYNQNHYAESSDLCRKILSINHQNPQAQMLYGINLMEQDSFQQAINEFNILSSNTINYDGIYYPSALWYASLCYLSLDNPQQASIELEKLQSLNNSFKGCFPVEKLLGELNR